MQVITLLQIAAMLYSILRSTGNQCKNSTTLSHHHLHHHPTTSLPQQTPYQFPPPAASPSSRPTPQSSPPLVKYHCHNGPSPSALQPRHNADPDLRTPIAEMEIGAVHDDKGPRHGEGCLVENEQESE